jgi:hypothetical protein
LNGAVAGYAASLATSTEFTGKKEATILTKPVPAGSYIVSAKTVVASTATASVRAAVVCELLDGGPGTTVDSSGWDTELAEEIPGAFIGETTLSLEAAVTVKATTSVSLVCSDLTSDPSGQTFSAAFSQIVAVKTTENM